MDAPYRVDIDPGRARELAQSGAIILLLDVPNGTVVAIDQQGRSPNPDRMQAYIVGPNFKGVKMVPPGAHFVSSNAVSSQRSAAAVGGGSDVAPTASFFVDVALREVVIRRWDKQEELLLSLEDADEEARLTQAARSFQFDASLAPYNLSALQQWRSVSGHITEALMEKVAPLNSGNLSVTTEADPFLKGPRTAAEERLAAQLQSKADLGSRVGVSAAGAGPDSSGAHAAEQAGWGSQGGQPGASSGPESAAPDQAAKAGSPGWPAGDLLPEQAARHAPETAGSAAAAAHVTQLPAKQAQRGIGRCFYIAVPQRATGAELSPEELTRLNMDKSALLQRLVREYGGDALMLLGELQFALLAFLLGHSLEAFGQWKALLHLLLSCEEAPVQTMCSFYAQALNTVHAQLSFCLTSSRDTEEQASPLQLGMTSELLGDSFLKTLFTRFYHMLQLHSPISHKGLQAAARQLQEFLERELGWDLTANDLQGDTEDEDAPIIVEL